MLSRVAEEAASVDPDLHGPAALTIVTAAPSHTRPPPHDDAFNEADSTLSGRCNIASRLLDELLRTRKLGALMTTRRSHPFARAA